MNFNPSCEVKGQDPNGSGQPEVRSGEGRKGERTGVQTLVTEEQQLRLCYIQVDG